jgi:hypothetical protein
MSAAQHGRVDHEFQADGALEAIGLEDGIEGGAAQVTSEP